MGSAFDRNLTQWSRGEYPGANNTQDDLSIITSNNGFGYRIDDHGNDNGSATPLTFAGSSVTGGGIVERNTDVDVFSFTTSGGTVNLNIDPFERGPNLDILAELYDAANNLIVSSNPLNLLDATISTALSAGQYFLHVTGVGAGDPLATGYSDYGSLGQYSISGSVPGMPPGITVTPGTGNSFTVKLDSQPTSDVTISVMSSNEGEITVDTSQLVFTAANWNTARTVTLMGVDSSGYARIRLAPATSTDAAYGGMDADDILATNELSNLALFTYRHGVL
jgi:hypothetical protein